MIFRSPISLLLVVFMACGCSHDSPSVPTATKNRETGEATDSDGNPAGSETATPPPGMVWIEGGEFTMGSEDEMSRFNERPVHQVEVTRFWIDVTPVTNAQFQKFVDATGYVTIAERKPDWEELRKQLPPETPRPDDNVLVAGSMVFTGSDGPVDLRQMANFWTWTPGASWQHPEGPDSDLQGRENYPVVQVAWVDAVAFAKWADKRLPTEAEWEFAARGQSHGRYHWGDEFLKDGQFMANTWTGEFPFSNTEEDGFRGSAPVRSFPANSLGLYGMAGNVWNWCSDWYQPDTYQQRVGEPMCCDPKGPSAGPRAGAPQVEHVVKGGSFLCHPDYCASYRPSARRGLPADTGMSHVGFRCVRSPGPGQPFDATVAGD
jgi:formylglycine-generating enzyme required for sulfatase activity